jgi:hypothetical protein
MDGILAEYEQNSVGTTTSRFHMNGAEIIWVDVKHWVVSRAEPL